MIIVFAVILVVHGLIHLLGFAKAFGLAKLPQLTQPIASWSGAGDVRVPKIEDVVSHGCYSAPRPDREVDHGTQDKS